MVLLSKLLYKEKIKPEEIEDTLRYRARSLGYLELKAEQKRAISSILTDRDHLAISCSLWSELHPLPTRCSGSAQTALSAAALRWLLDERSGTRLLLYTIDLLGNPVGNASPTTISNCRPSSVLHCFCRFSASLLTVILVHTRFALCAPLLTRNCYHN